MILHRPSEKDPCSRPSYARKFCLAKSTISTAVWFGKWNVISISTGTFSLTQIQYTVTQNFLLSTLEFWAIIKLKNILLRAVLILNFDTSLRSVTNFTIRKHFTPGKGQSSIQQMDPRGGLESVEEKNVSDITLFSVSIHAYPERCVSLNSVLTFHVP